MNFRFWKRQPPAIQETTTEKDGEDLTPWELQFIDKAKCPDCQSGLLEGPHGGMAVNVYCANPDECGSRFNILWPGLTQRISDRQPAIKCRDTN